jgi:hypothetical protein
MTAIERQERKVEALKWQYVHDKGISDSLVARCAELSAELGKMRMRAKEQMQVVSAKGEELIAAMRELDRLRELNK